MLGKKIQKHSALNIHQNRIHNKFKCKFIVHYLIKIACQLNHVNIFNINIYTISNTFKRCV